MRRIPMFLVVAVSCGLITAMLLGERPAATPEGRAATLPAPSGRTLEDVRKEYTQARLPGNSARAPGNLVPATPPPRIVDADVFVLTDARGNVRTEMGVADSGTKIQMFDTRGKARLVLAEDDGVATVTLLGDDGKADLELRVTPQGDARVAIGPPNAKFTAPLEMRIAPGDDAKITLRNRTGVEAVDLSSHADEGGIVTVHQGDDMAHLQAHSLSLQMAQGGPFATLGLLNGNRAQFNMSRGGGTRNELEMTCGDDGSWLTLSTKEFGSADLRAMEKMSMLALKPRNGVGGLESITRVQEGKTTAYLHLSDVDGLPKVSADVTADGKASLGTSRGE